MFLEALKNNGCGVGDLRDPVEVHVTYALLTNQLIHCNEYYYDKCYLNAQ